MTALLLPTSLATLIPQGIQESCEGAWVKKRAYLFRAGAMPQWMYYVVAGEVTLERPGLHGEVVILQRTRQGFVSEASLKVSRYHCDAVAVSDTQVIKVPVKMLTKALDQDPAFANRWMQMLNGEIRRLRLHLERLSMKSVRERLIHLIETEGQVGRYEAASGLKTLAAELGITHEALYRTVAALEGEQVLRRECNQLILIR